MSWQIEYDGELGVIRCVYAGHVSHRDYEAGTLRTIALAKQHRTQLILIDESALVSTDVSTMEIYHMPAFYARVDADRRSKWALILPPGGQVREDVQFFVTMCVNRGWYVQAFDDHGAAVDWLLNEPGD